MFTTINLTILFLSIFASITFNGFLRNISRANNLLIDIPEKSRKFHDRATPLTGGISIYVATLVSALLLTGLTNINLDTEITGEGFLKNSAIYEETLNRRYKVNNIEYDLLLEKNDSSRSISIEIDVENKSPVILKVEPYVDGKFLVTLPDGEKQIYSYANGIVTNNLLDLPSSYQNISPTLISPLGFSLFRDKSVGEKK